MQKPRIIISVYGGLVQDVFCSVRDAQVVLVDWDQDAEAATEESVAKSGPIAPLVGAFAVRPIDDLVDTEEHAVIRDACDKGVLDEGVFVVS